MFYFSITTWLLIYLSIGMIICNASESITRNQYKREKLKYEEMGLFNFIISSMLWPLLIIVGIIRSRNN